MPSVCKIRLFRVLQKEKMWLEQEPHIRQLQSNIPESTGPTANAFQTHVLYVLRHRDTFLGFHGSKRHRQQRWGVYIKKQRAVQYMCNKVTGGRVKAEVTVAFGSARGPHMTGTLPAPVKLLHTALQSHAIVVGTDEFRTSVVSSKCNHNDMVGVKCSKGMSVAKWQAGKRDNSDRFQLYDLRACQNPSCRTVWNRNVNAARNMLEVYLNIVARGMRPVGFRQ